MVSQTNLQARNIDGESWRARGDPFEKALSTQRMTQLLATISFESVGPCHWGKVEVSSKITLVKLLPKIALQIFSALSQPPLVIYSTLLKDLWPPLDFQRPLTTHLHPSHTLKLSHKVARGEVNNNFICYCFKHTAKAQTQLLTWVVYDKYKHTRPAATLFIFPNALIRSAYRSPMFLPQIWKEAGSRCTWKDNSKLCFDIPTLSSEVMELR